MSTWTPERGLLVVAATDMEDRAEGLSQRGKYVVKKQVQMDVDGLKKDIRRPDRRGVTDPFGRLT